MCVLSFVWIYVLCGTVHLLYKWNSYPSYVCIVLGKIQDKCLLIMFQNHHDIMKRK